MRPAVPARCPGPRRGRSKRGRERGGQAPQTWRAALLAATLVAAGPGSDPVCGAVGVGRIPGPQVQRLRSSELAGRNSTSPNASPRPSGESPRGGAGKSFDSGPPEKVARRSPGGSLSVDVENGAGCSPMPSPAAGPVFAHRRSVCAMQSTCRKHRDCVECDKLVCCRVALERSVSAGLASLLTLSALRNVHLQIRRWVAAGLGKSGRQQPAGRTPLSRCAVHHVFELPVAEVPAVASARMPLWPYHVRPTLGS